MSLLHWASKRQIKIHSNIAIMFNRFFTQLKMTLRKSKLTLLYTNEVGLLKGVKERKMRYTGGGL